jgi:hypothetical protein
VQNFLRAAQPGEMAFAGQVIQLRVGQVRNDMLPVVAVAELRELS